MRGIVVTCSRCQAFGFHIGDLIRHLQYVKSPNYDYIVFSFGQTTTACAGVRLEYTTGHLCHHYARLLVDGFLDLGVAVDDPVDTGLLLPLEREPRFFFADDVSQ